MKRHRIFQWFWSDDKPQQQDGSSERLVFSGNGENLIKNGEILLEDRVSLFDGRTNPIRCFTVDDLNSMNVNNDIICSECVYNSYAGMWDGKSVMVKTFHNDKRVDLACREIAVATEMGTHTNVHRLLGFCLDTNCPVLVYEWPENGTLDCRRVPDYNEQNEEAFKLKDILRIGWEIAHAVAYLHTAFRRPIIHRNLKRSVVFLGQDGSARLSDFSFCISIPKGETHVMEDKVIGTWGYLAPEYAMSGRVAESSDVYAFGVLLFVLLTGKPAIFTSELDHGQVKLVHWVDECWASDCLNDIFDQAITIETVADDHFDRQLKEFVELGLRCTSDEQEYRPTMVEVATQLKNMITLSSDSF